MTQPSIGAPSLLVKRTGSADRTRIDARSASLNPDSLRSALPSSAETWTSAGWVASPAT